MNFEIIPTPDFSRSLKVLAKRHRSLKDDFKAFIQSLRNDPFQGVELTEGLRKIRLTVSSKRRGKSGGARVITYTVILTEFKGEIYLLDIYDKTDYDSVDVNILKKIITELDITGRPR